MAVQRALWQTACSRNRLRTDRIVHSEPDKWTEMLLPEIERPLHSEGTIDVEHRSRTWQFDDSTAEKYDALRATRSVDYGFRHAGEVTRACELRDRRYSSFVSR